MIYVAPGQHWDLLWKRSPRVSERMGVNNIRRALDIMKENPRFKYVLDQLYLWEAFQRHFSGRKEELRRRVKEKRIELSNGGYLNPDFNIPSGESLIRNFFYTKNTFKKEFGVEVKTVWCEDSFGQSGQLPQIFKKLGLEFHTAKRGASKDLPGVFLWQGVDGSQIFFDRQPMAHHGITSFPPFSVIPSIENPKERLEELVKPIGLPLALMAIYLPDLYLWVSTKGRVHTFRAALKCLVEAAPDNHIFIPHGFLADGARPNAWIEYFSRVYSELSGNKMFISTPSEYLEHLKKIQDRLLVVKGELNGPTEPDGEPFGAMPGSYSARMGVKQRIRKMERGLYQLELLETMKMLQGDKYRDTIDLWKSKFITDFHDSACGTLIEDNYNFAKQKALAVIKKAEQRIAKNLSVLAGKKSVFNPLPWERTDLVGGQLVTAEALGLNEFKTAEVKERFTLANEKKELLTPFYRVTWQNGLQIYRQGERITGEKFARIRVQDEKGDTYFWNLSNEYWDEVETTEIEERSAYRVVLKIVSHWRKTRIIQRLHFYLHTPRIDFKTSVDNKEKDMRIQVHFPLNMEMDKAVVEREIPGGFIREGESTGQASWQERFGEKYAYYDRIKCVQNWIHFGSGEKGIAIFNDGLPEHEIVGQACFITLLRCVGRVGTEGKGLNKIKPAEVPWRAGSPHPIPLAQEQGRHTFRYAICPCQRKEAAGRCYEFLFPLLFVSGKNKKEKSLSPFSISDSSVIPMAIKKAEDKKAVIVRLLETEGKDKEIEIRLNPEFHFKSAKLTNLMEESIKDLKLEKNKIILSIKAQEIVTLESK